MSPRAPQRQYLAFHGAASPYADRMTTALSDRATGDIGDVIGHSNAKLATSCRNCPDPAKVGIVTKVVEDMKRQDACGIVLESDVARPCTLGEEGKPSLPGILRSGALKPLGVRPASPRR